MATVNAYIRVSTLKKKKVNVRFRLRDGRRVQLFYTSELEISPEYWDAVRQEMKGKVAYDSFARAEFNKAIADHKSSIIEIYHNAPNKEETTSEWLAAEMDKALHPKKYNLIERQETFFQTIESFIECRKMSDVRKRNFRVILRALQRFELHKCWCGSKDYRLTLGRITAKTLSEFEEFLRNEHLLAAKYPKIYKAVPESRSGVPICIIYRRGALFAARP